MRATRFHSPDCSCARSAAARRTASASQRGLNSWTTLIYIFTFAAIILGLANLLADGFSMAAGNYSGTKSEVEDYERLRERERVLDLIESVTGGRFHPNFNRVGGIKDDLPEGWIDEAREAGITEFIFVTSRGKSALEDYFDVAPDLEAALESKGKDDLLDVLQTTNMDSGAIAYIRQNRPLGLGHAVWCARRLIGDEPFAILLADDMVKNEGRGALSQMVSVYEETGASVGLIPSGRFPAASCNRSLTT